MFPCVLIVLERSSIVNIKSEKVKHNCTFDVDYGEKVRYY